MMSDLTDRPTVQDPCPRRTCPGWIHAYGIRRPLGQLDDQLGKTPLDHMTIVHADPSGVQDRYSEFHGTRGPSSSGIASVLISIKQWLDSPKAVRCGRLHPR